MEVVLKLSLLTLTLSLGCSLVLAQSSKFADDLQQCAKTTQINICLNNTLEDLRDFMSTGLPDLNLKPTDPLRIDNIEFQSTLPLVTVNSKFSNVQVNGLKKFHTNNINADVVNRVLFLDLSVPNLDVSGNYDLDGTVLFIKIFGNGPFTSLMSGVTGRGTAKIVPVGPVGNQRLTVADMVLDFDIKSVKVEMKNLFDGENQELAKVVNDALSTNSDLIIEQVKPQITMRVSQLVGKVINDAFSKINVQDFIKTIESQRSAAVRRPPAATRPLPQRPGAGGPGKRFGGLFQ